MAERPLATFRPLNFYYIYRSDHGIRYCRLCITCEASYNDRLYYKHTNLQNNEWDFQSVVTRGLQSKRCCIFCISLCPEPFRPTNQYNLIIIYTKEGFQLSSLIRRTSPLQTMQGNLNTHTHQTYKLVLDIVVNRSNGSDHFCTAQLLKSKTVVRSHKGEFKKKKKNHEACTFLPTTDARLALMSKTCVLSLISVQLIGFRLHRNTRLDGSQVFFLSFVLYANIIHIETFRIYFVQVQHFANTRSPYAKN